MRNTNINYRSKLSLLPAGFGALGLLFGTGCHIFGHKAVPTLVHPAIQGTTISPLDLTKFQPNEAGDVPILEYHDMVTSSKTTGYQYPIASFRGDLEWLYAHNYRPVSLSDYVNGKIDCAAGMSPVILTFDDALRGQFYYTPDGKIDPNCAVGVMDDFHAKHPDWALRGTFFVLTNGDPKLPPSFYQAEYAQSKMEYLVREGFEIGNHTVHHRKGIRNWSDSAVQAEFAQAVTNIHAMLPTYKVQTLALPYGVFPKNQKLVIRGSSGGVSYSNICALLAGAGPAPCPESKKFNPYRLPRIIPGNERFALRYWLDWLEKNKSHKFISDGDPQTYTVDAIAKGTLNVKKLLQAGYNLRTYSGTHVIGTMTPSKLPVSY